MDKVDKMELFKIIITICAINSYGPYQCYEESVPVGKSLNGTCKKSTIEVLSGKYNALSNSSYRIVKWKCERKTS